jgi:hypothetical protein
VPIRASNYYKDKPVEAPMSRYPHSRVRDDIDDETWHRIRDQEERERKEWRR